MPNSDLSPDVIDDRARPSPAASSNVAESATALDTILDEMEEVLRDLGTRVGRRTIRWGLMTAW